MRNNKSRAAVRLDLTNPLLTDIENWRRSQEKTPPARMLSESCLKQALKESEHAAA